MLLSRSVLAAAAAVLVLATGCDRSPSDPTGGLQAGTFRAEVASGPYRTTLTGQAEAVVLFGDDFVRLWTTSPSLPNASWTPATSVVALVAPANGFHVGTHAVTGTWNKPDPPATVFADWWLDMAPLVARSGTVRIVRMTSTLVEGDFEITFGSDNDGSTALMKGAFRAAR
jgi:hypothetical protein